MQLQKGQAVVVHQNIHFTMEKERECTHMERYCMARSKYLLISPQNRQDKCWRNFNLMVTVVRGYDVIISNSHLPEVAAMYIIDP